MIRALTLALAATLGLFQATQAPAQNPDLVQADLRPGWRLADGSHMAALHLRLAPGWKTYWRAPGDAGIPPVFNWSGSRNTAHVDVLWPAPHVFRQSGMRSVGYSRELVLPLRITPSAKGGPIELHTEMDLGICSDICVPQTLRISASLPASGRPDPVIASALASAPFSESEAGVGQVRCTITPDKKGLRLRAEIDMPRAGSKEDAVIESALVLSLRRFLAVVQRRVEQKQNERAKVLVTPCPL